MPKKILVVDDEPNIVLSLNFLMKQAGYETRTANNGNEALKAIEEESPDLVLLDVNMPGCTGYEVCERVKTHPPWQDIVVVMLTAKGRDVEREKGLALGADDYITKPFATQEVVDKVKDLLAK